MLFFSMGGWWMRGVSGVTLIFGIVWHADCTARGIPWSMHPPVVEPIR